ncbi:hypothetical protein [Candidatus Cryosericum septentrionale]|uniref:Uncharacterized protein n=1 Tax=Candidatus Cryosericum septentrionale TaxID=2290913 RepID=A0A398DQR3_9BACT|nr:hypothetical protein [Candidatus Cryosericum septentrionale]RIE17595.1 hypothetical protein SMC1_01355 [Candidatus Cryosericum septentrionale]
MNLLDICTILIGAVVSDAICALVIGAVWLQYRRSSSGLGLWTAGLRRPDDVDPPLCPAWTESDVRV